MAKRKRNKEIIFMFHRKEERKLIRRKMIESKTKNMGAYLRKMAIDGYIVNTDTTPLKKQYEEMHKIGVNINQIAKKVNSTGDLYPEEMQELKEMVKELLFNLFDDMFHHPVHTLHSGLPFPDHQSASEAWLPVSHQRLEYAQTGNDQ